MRELYEKAILCAHDSAPSRQPSRLKEVLPLVGEVVGEETVNAKGLRPADSEDLQGRRIEGY